MGKLGLEIMRQSEACGQFPDCSYYVVRSERKASGVGGYAQPPDVSNLCEADAVGALPIPLDISEFLVDLQLPVSAPLCLQPLSLDLQIRVLPTCMADQRSKELTLSPLSRQMPQSVALRN